MSWRSGTNAASETLRYRESMRLRDGDHRVFQYSEMEIRNSDLLYSVSLGFGERKRKSATEVEVDISEEKSREKERKEEEKKKKMVV